MTKASGSAGNMIRSLDANADGLADYLVFDGDYNCPGAAALFAPTAASGVGTALFLSRANGQVELAWSGETWGPELVRQGNQVAMTFPMTGSACGDDRGDTVSVAERYSCALQLRPDQQGKWDLQELVKGKPLFSASVAPAIGKAQQAIVATAKSYVDSIYKRLLPMFDNPASFDWRTGVRYTPELDHLLTQDEIPGEVGRLDVVPFCDCQDMMPRRSFTIVSAVTTAPGKATVTVSLVNGGKPQPFRIDLVKLAAGWAVADIHTPTMPSLVVFLRKGIALHKPEAALPAAPAPGLGDPLPARVVWTGILTSNTVPNLLISASIANSGGKLSGTIIAKSVFQGGESQYAVKGSYKDSQCKISFGQRTYKGACSANGFSGSEKFLGDTDGILTLLPDGAARLQRSASRFPARFNYTGTARSTTGAFQSPETLALDQRQGVFRGWKQDQFGQMPVAGFAMDGNCTFLAGKKLRYVGPCDRSSFTGSQYLSDKAQLTFRYGSAASTLVERDAAARPAQRQAPATSRAPAQGASTPPIFNMGVETPAGRTGSFGAENGWFDYVEGDDLPEEEAQLDRRGGDSGGGGGGYNGRGSGSYQDGGDGNVSGGSAGLSAPAGTVWAYGRNRWVVQPGGRCGPDSQLVKGYCFGTVMAHMRRNPKVKSVVAITLSRPTSLGTWVSTDTPIRYGYVEVYRNKDDNGFHADKHLTGTAKVKTPLGCHYSPVAEGFVLAAPGPQGLQEAALFRCP